MGEQIKDGAEHEKEKDCVERRKGGGGESTGTKADRKEEGNKKNAQQPHNIHGHAAVLRK
jgi:hypothetical protein